jgi:hypothetical protein
MSMATEMDSPAVAVRAGACAAWALPRSPECAGQARRVVREVAGEFGLAAGFVDDLLVVTSELVTNALVHGGDHVLEREGRPVAGLPELWLYLRGSSPTELVLTVYDAGTSWSRTLAAGGEGLRENGRGLPIVAALARQAGGCWGRHATRSRLGERRLPGTAVWFARPLPSSAGVGPVPVAVVPGDAVARLAELLRGRGLDRLITRANGVEAVLSLPAGLTVWCRYGCFSWHAAAGPQRCPVGDVVDATERVLAEVERARRGGER